jgi:hypothetical protein
VDDVISIEAEANKKMAKKTYPIVIKILLL